MMLGRSRNHGWRLVASTNTAHFTTTALYQSYDPSVPSEMYSQLVKNATITKDEAQWRVLHKYMDKLHRQLHTFSLPDTSSQSKSVVVPRGLYIHGEVGTGKSMLMDLFFQHVCVARKKRVHFNKFMLDVHQRLQIVKKQHLDLYGRQRNISLDPHQDAISIVAKQLVQESHLLCFDEFQVCTLHYYI